MSGSCSSNKPTHCYYSHPHHQPPLNPFRTQQQHPRCSEDSRMMQGGNGWFANPCVQACYVAAVVALMIAVSGVAYTALSQLTISSNPPVHHPYHHHRYESPPLLHTNKSKNIRLGGGVQSLSRLLPLASASSSSPPLVVDPSDIASAETTDGRIGAEPEDDNAEKEFLSVFPQEEDETTDVASLEDEEELLSRPGGGVAHWKLLRETKDIVRKELDREADVYGDHAFGLQSSSSGGASTNESYDPGQALLLDTSINQTIIADVDAAEEIHNEVQVLHRKGESDKFVVIDLEDHNNLANNDSLIVRPNAIIRIPSLNDGATSESQGVGKVSLTNSDRTPIEVETGQVTFVPDSPRLRRSRPDAVQVD